MVLDKWERVNRRICVWFEWIGLVGLLVMMVITCIDVVGAKVLSWRLMGALDIVMLAQIVAIAFAAGMALILGRHIQVEFLLVLLPERIRAVTTGVIHLLCLGLFIIIVWRLSVLGWLFQVGGEYSATIYIPYYPFAYGIALASIPVCSVFLLEFLKLLQSRKG
ncbi:MAG: TRAP transporter small permease [Thermodesulfobacteriota bacterium]